MKKYTVEARLCHKTLNYVFYETITVEADDGRNAMSIAHSLIVDKYRTDASVNRLQVVKTQKLDNGGNDEL